MPSANENDCPHQGLADTGVPCPRCGRGTMAPARGRFGPVWRCSDGECSFWLQARPTGEVCPFPRNGAPCGELIVEGTKTIPNRCSDRECPNNRPDRLARTGD